MSVLRWLARRILPPLWRARLRSTALRLRPSLSEQAVRATAEARHFAGQEYVHDLPPIHHFWAERYLQPMCRQLGFEDVEGFFLEALAERIDCVARDGGEGRIASLGAGNGDLEVRLAGRLREQGRNAFVFDCLEVNPAMLERGRALAAAAGLTEQVRFVTADLNAWVPERPYAAVIANQSLHHVVGLEHLFDSVAAAIGSDGVFLVADMIGRNGHMRWPEARELVQAFWEELPRAYRYNLQLHRHERRFKDWDCSVEGFEGIRAQDILPLLVQRFGFDLFLAWGNLVDPFIDRAFGPHFDPARAWDRDFISRVHARDEEELQAGRITPTHMIAVLRTNRGAVPRVRGALSPAACVRRP
jgi:SAM-dependent methyltransferase